MTTTQRDNTHAATTAHPCARKLHTAPFAKIIGRGKSSQLTLFQQLTKTFLRTQAFSAPLCRRVLLVGTYIILAFSLTSCFKANPHRSNEVPTEFFGAHFGESPVEVKDHFAQHKIHIAVPASSYGYIYHYRKVPECYVDYLDVSWGNIDAIFDKEGRLVTLRFCTLYETKQEALEAYDKALHRVEKHYRMEVMPQDNPQLFRKHGFIDSHDHALLMGCSSFVASDGKEIFNIKLEITE